MSLNKVKKEQLKIFKERIRPNIDTLSEGTDIVRGVKGFKKVLTDNKEVQWSDLIRFSHPKIADISIWEAFVEKYGHFLQFNENPLEDKPAFIKELHDLIERLNRSIITPNHFTVVRERPRVNVYTEGTLEIARGSEKFESELQPKIYKVEFSLEWNIKT